MGAEVELPTDELFPLFRRKSSPSARKFLSFLFLDSDRLAGFGITKESGSE